MIKDTTINTRNMYLKIMILSLLTLFLGSPSFYSFSETKQFENKKIHVPFLYNPLVPQELWNELKPYFLPEDHPIKSKLDHLFSQIRATQSAESFEEAGFGKPFIRQPTNIMIGKHVQFKGYVFKVYLDTQPHLNEWVNWVQRIEGAKAIQACIDRHGFHHFCVPKKWIYPLPADPSPPNDPSINRKNFILIVENVNHLPKKQLLKAFKKKITPQILLDLAVILKEEGLIDSTHPDNIPFTTSGRLAFIDTEHHYPGREIPYENLTPFLSRNMQKFWQSITNTNN